MKQTTIYDFLQPNFVQQIYDFNKQAGLLEKGYDDFLESSFQIEEALEGLDNIEKLGKCLTLDNYHHLGKEANKSPREVSRAIVTLAMYDNPLAKIGYRETSDVDRLDKAIDAIVFAVGSIAKLGLNVEQIQRAISVVTKANLQKLSMPKDAHGKLTKPTNFVGPEHELQQILNERVIK